MINHDRHKPRQSFLYPNALSAASTEPYAFKKSAPTIQYGKSDGKRQQIMRVHYFDSMDLWFTRELDTPPLPSDDFKNNRIVLSEPFARDIERYHPPIELSAVAEWSDAPGQLYFYLWLVWRCYVATKQTPIPLFGQGGVMEQCGAQGYSEHWKFRQMVRKWLGGVKAAWPQCPADLLADGEYRSSNHCGFDKPGDLCGSFRAHNLFWPITS